MLTQKLAADNSKDKEERASRRKMWASLLVLLLLVAGIVYAPPFARDHHINDSTQDRPKVATKDESQGDSNETGTVLGQNTRPRHTSSNKTTPVFTPTPTPEPLPLTQPALPQLPTLPTIPTPTVPDDEPEIDEPIACDAPTPAQDEAVLASTNLEFDRYNNNVYQNVYLAVTDDNCPVSWEALNTDETIFWPGDDHTGKALPAMMIVESDRNPETGMHHGNTLRFRFKVGESGVPVYEHQFNFALHTEGNDTPKMYTITVKVITPEDNTCYDESCLPPAENTDEPQLPVEEDEPEPTTQDETEPTATTLPADETTEPL